MAWTRAPWTPPPGSVLPHEDRGVPLISRIQIFDDAVKKHSYARRRSGDVLAARADDLIAAYPYGELLRIAQNLSRTERGPSRAHYAAAEKLLTAVLERAPTGSSQWRTAALALSDIQLSVRGDTESALALLEKFQQTKPAVDMIDSWQFAEAREGRPIGDSDKLAALTAELEWSPIERPRHRIGYELNLMEEHHWSYSACPRAHIAAENARRRLGYPLQKQQGVLVGPGLRSARGLGGQPAHL